MKITDIEKLNETTSEQYERMLDQAGELGETIAGNVILDDHTDAFEQGIDRSDPEQISAIVDKHLAVAEERMRMVASRYIRRRFRT